MKTGMIGFGVLLALMGTIWFLQGVNALTAGTSPMMGDTRWAYYGGIAIAAGVGLVVVGRRRR